MSIPAFGRAIGAILLSLSVIFGSESGRTITLTETLMRAKAHAHELARSSHELSASERQLSASLRDRLPTLSIAVATLYNDFIPSLRLDIPNVPPLERDVGIHESFLTEARLTVPLSAGGRIGASIDAATAERDARQAVHEGGVNAILLDARIAWHESYRARELIRAAEAGRERVKLLDQEVRFLIVAGTADSVSYYEVAIALSRAESELESAQSMARLAATRLAVRIGLPADSLLTTDGELPDAPEIDTAEYRSFLERHPLLSLARSHTALTRAQIQSARGDLFPMVSAYAGYGYGKPYLDRFNSEWHDNYSLGASLNWSFNLGNRAGHLIQSRRELTRSAEAAEARLIETLVRDEREARERMVSSERQYQLSSERFRLAERNYGHARGRHREGLLATNRLLEIELELTRAEATAAVTLVDFYLAQSYWLYAVQSEKLATGW